MPERRLVCVGKHLHGRSALVSLSLLPALYASRRDSRELEPLEQDVVRLLEEEGPCSTADLPDLIGHERKRVARSVERLQRLLVLTSAGAQERPSGWPAVIVDLLGRRYATALRNLPGTEDARVRVADVVIASASEVSAADLAAVIGCRRKEASAALDRLVDQGTARRRDEEGFALYRRFRKRAQ